MNTIALTSKKRKVIDIPEDVFRNLSVKAAAEGESLKDFVDSLLASEANGASDEDLYNSLLKIDLEGKEYLNQEDETSFEKQLGV